MAQNDLGDLRFSILRPDVFQKLNPGWILLAGQAMERNWDLYRLLTEEHLLADPQYRNLVNNLPDARGVFLRGKNEGRETAQGDPDGDTHIVGDQQMDAIKKHTHSYLKGYYPEAGKSGGGEPVVWSANTSVQTDANSDGADETRPRNITVYIYIKVV